MLLRSFSLAVFITLIAEHSANSQDSQFKDVFKSIFDPYSLPQELNGFVLHDDPISPIGEYFERISLYEKVDDVNIETFSGNIVIVTIISTPRDMFLLEGLDALQSKFSEGLSVVPLHIDPTGRHKNAFLKRMREAWVKYKIDNISIHIDPKAKFARQAGIVGTPTTLIFGPDGREAGRITGVIDWESSTIQSMFRILLDSYKLNSQKISNKHSKAEDSIEIESFPFCPRGNELCGYIDRNGKVVIEPRFNVAYPFGNNGLASIVINGKYGYIDYSGNVKIEPKFYTAGDFKDNETTWAALSPNSYIYIDDIGEPLIDRVFYGSYGESFSDNGLLAVKEEDQGPANKNPMYGYVDKSGDYVINPQFSYAYNFSTYGLAKIMVRDENKKLQTGYIDSKGTYVIKPSQNLYGKEFSNNGLAPAYLGEKKSLWGYINWKGYFVIKPTFDNAYKFSSNGLAAVEIDNEIGYINKFGDIIIEPKFSAYSSVNDYAFNEYGIAKAGIGSKGGVINESGEFIFGPHYDIDNIYLMGDLIRVRFDKKDIYYNLNGDVIAE